MQANSARKGFLSTGVAARKRALIFLTVLVALGLMLLAGLAWSRLVSTLRDAKPIAAPARPHVDAIVWGGRVFTQKRSLESWLAARGRSYAEWERRHKAATRLLVTRSR